MSMSRVTNPLLLVSLVLVGAFLGPRSLGEPEAPPSLYERLGRSWGLAVIVDLMVQRLDTKPEPKLSAQLRSAVNSIPRAALRFELTSYFCQLTGGPHKYAGPSPLELARRIEPLADDWMLFHDTLVDCLVSAEADGLAAQDLIDEVCSSQSVWEHEKHPDAMFERFCDGVVRQDAAAVWRCLGSRAKGSFKGEEELRSLLSSRAEQLKQLYSHCSALNFDDRDGGVTVRWGDGVVRNKSVHLVVENEVDRVDRAFGLLD